jgi:hypothetical protein
MLRMGLPGLDLRSEEMAERAQIPHLEQPLPRAGTTEERVCWLIDPRADAAPTFQISKNAMQVPYIKLGKEFLLPLPWFQTATTL